MNILHRLKISTFQTIVIGFALLILAGSLLLMLPAASRPSGSTPFSDCLFTATSAACVTGLIVRDTATHWTLFGQVIILFLIQIGGMGVVTTGAVLAFISGRRIDLKERSVMQEAIAAPQVGGIVRLTRFFVAVALAIEGIGALLLMPVFIPMFGFGKGCFYAFFHAISAFCNAGFDLMGIREPFSSMTGFSEHILLNLVLILLITIGGIGFLVWNDVKDHGFRVKQYRLQSKIVLTTSAVLVIGPFLWFFFFEMQELSAAGRILPSLFQSVTMRTAGFNTVDLNQMSGGGQALMLFLMLTGGSPGSTAGGMKTTTVAVLFLTAAAVFRRKNEVGCYGRRIGEETIRNAIAVLMMYMVLFMCSGIVISRIEHLPLSVCLFETASAVGTVGLTLGITSSIGTVSRIILIVLMFLGRVGGLTLIYAAQSVRSSARSIYPLEKVTVG